MIPMWVFTGVGAFLLAACAAFFSITGLAALYAAAFIPVVIMAVTIEYGKISATFWLHRNYKKASKLLITLLAIAVIGSMAVTSGGVYGFLTKGHVDQETPLTDTNLRVERLNGKITAQRNIIDRAQQRIDQLDGVIQTLIDYDKISGPTGANAVREKQALERKSMQTAIDSSYTEIDRLSEQRLTLNQKNATIEAKLGPVRYLASLFKSDTDKAVQWFTLLIVLLLDPFAIMLVLATSSNYNEWILRKRKDREYLEENPTEIIVEIEKEIIKELNLEETDINKIKDFLNDKGLLIFNEVDLENAKNQWLMDNKPEPVIIEKEVIKVVSEVVKEEIPLTMETLTDFLDNKEIQEELIQNPDLIKEVELLIEHAKTGRGKKGRWIKGTAGWVNEDEEPKK